MRVNENRARYLKNIYTIWLLADMGEVRYDMAIQKLNSCSSPKIFRFIRKEYAAPTSNNFIAIAKQVAKEPFQNILPHLRLHGARETVDSWKRVGNMHVN